MAIRSFGARHTEVDALIREMRTLTPDEIAQIASRVTPLHAGVRGRMRKNAQGKARAAGRGAAWSSARAYAYDSLRSAASAAGIHYSRIPEHPDWATAAELLRDAAAVAVVSDLVDPNLAYGLAEPLLAVRPRLRREVLGS